MTGHRIPLERKLSSRALREDRNKRWGSAAGQEKSCGNRAEMKTHCTVVLLLRYLLRQKRRESANDELRILSLSCCAFDWLRVNSLNVDWQLYQGNGNGKTILGDGGGWGWNSAGTGGDRKKSTGIWVRVGAIYIHLQLSTSEPEYVVKIRSKLLELRLAYDGRYSLILCRK